jgi:hypothetical protein
MDALLEDWNMLCKGTSGKPPRPQGNRTVTYLRRKRIPGFSASRASSAVRHKPVSSAGNAPRTQMRRSDGRQGCVNLPKSDDDSNLFSEWGQGHHGREGHAIPSSIISLPEPASLRDQEWQQLLELQSRHHMETRKGFLNSRVLTLLRQLVK